MASERSDSLHPGPGRRQINGIRIWVWLFGKWDSDFICFHTPQGTYGKQTNIPLSFPLQVLLSSCRVHNISKLVPKEICMYRECSVTTQQWFLQPPSVKLHGCNANVMPEILQYLGTEMYADSLSSEPGAGGWGKSFFWKAQMGTHMVFEPPFMACQKPEYSEGIVKGCWSTVNLWDNLFSLSRVFCFLFFSLYSEKPNFVFSWTVP